MKKEDISVLAQLLSAMKDSAEKIEEAQKMEDLELLTMAKREILSFQKQIDRILK